MSVFSCQLGKSGHCTSDRGNKVIHLMKQCKAITTLQRTIPKPLTALPQSSQLILSPMRALTGNSLCKCEFLANYFQTNCTITNYNLNRIIDGFI